MLLSLRPSWSSWLSASRPALGLQDALMVCRALRLRCSPAGPDTRQAAPHPWIPGLGALLVGLPWHVFLLAASVQLRPLLPAQQAWQLNLRWLSCCGRQAAGHQATLQACEEPRQQAAQAAVPGKLLQQLVVLLQQVLNVHIACLALLLLLLLAAVLLLLLLLLPLVLNLTLHRLPALLLLGCLLVRLPALLVLGLQLLLLQGCVALLQLHQLLLCVVQHGLALAVQPLGQAQAVLQPTASSSEACQQLAPQLSKVIPPPQAEADLAAGAERRAHCTAPTAACRASTGAAAHLQVLPLQLPVLLASTGLRLPALLGLVGGVRWLWHPGRLRGI